MEDILVKEFIQNSIQIIALPNELKTLVYATFKTITFFHY